MKDRAHDMRAEVRREAGFTLIELMISLTVVSVAIAAAFTMAFSLMNGFKTSRASVQTESTTRTVLDIIANGVRSASPGLPGGVLWDPCAGANIDTISVTNSTTAPDELRMIHALGGAVAFLRVTNNVLGGTPLVVDSNALFEKDLWVPAVIVDPLQAKGHLVEIKATGTNVQEILARKPFACATGGNGSDSYGPGSFIVRALNVHYYVDPPYLMVNPNPADDTTAEVMADGIEDMQIAIGIENGTDTSTLTDNNNATDEWIYNDSGDTAAGSVSMGDWRALRVTIVGYSRTEQSQATDRARPAAEDRDVGGGDSFRRRTFSSTLNVRSFASGN